MRRNTGIRIHAQLWDDLQALADATQGRLTRNQLVEQLLIEGVERARRKRGRTGVNLAREGEAVGPVSGQTVSAIIPDTHTPEST